MKIDLLNELHSLVSDTLHFIHQYHFLQVNTASFTSVSSEVHRKKEIIPIPIAIDKQKLQTPFPEKEFLSLCKEIKPNEKTETPVKKEKKEEKMLQWIAEYLPHLSIAREIPKKHKPSEVLIFVGAKKELYFLQNLAKAIQKNFCKVKLIDLEKIQALNKWDKLFSERQNILFILPGSFKENFPKKLQAIFLEETHTYTENIEKKKQMWSEICQILKNSL